MVVMFNLTDPVEREHAMANGKATPARLDWKAVLTSDDEDGFRALLQTVVQEVLEAEMTETLQAEKNERTTNRLGHRSGYYDGRLGRPAPSARRRARQPREPLELARLPRRA